MIIGRTFNDLTRVIKNKLSQEILDAESSGTDPNQILEMIGIGRTFKASVEGDVIDGSVMSGQIAGMIKEIKNVEQVMTEMVSGLQLVMNTVAKRLL